MNVVFDSYSVFLIDPDPVRFGVLSEDLRGRGFRLQGSSALPSLHQVSSDHHLVILAADQPAREAYAFCQLLRSRDPGLPLMMIESSGTDQARIAALQAGADDVQSFPCSLEEFALRLKALLRRVQASVPVASGHLIQYRDLQVNTVQRSVQRDAVSIRLTVKEYDLLLHLLQHKQQVCTRRDILHSVWGDTWVGDDNLLDVYIRYLRKKIERSDLEPLIHTIRGVGFMLN
jgi:two-component system response regulator MprA